MSKKYNSVTNRSLQSCLWVETFGPNPKMQPRTRIFNIKYKKQARKSTKVN